MSAPVNLPPAQWIVCFVPPMDRRFWHKLCHHRHKHAFALKYEGHGRWTLFEPWWTRLMLASINDEQAERFLKWARRGDALLVNEHIPGSSSQVRGWMTCAVLITHMLGRSYTLLTPHQLYRRLVQETDTKRIDLSDVRGFMRSLVGADHECSASEAA